MLEVPDNILKTFFESIFIMGKYEVVMHENGALIKPCLEDQYFKPVIVIKDLEVLEKSLRHFIESLNLFLIDNREFKMEYDLTYFLGNIVSNMASSDAMDLASFIDKRSNFFHDNQFLEFVSPQLLLNFDGINFYVQRILERPSFETPYILNFSMEIDGLIYQLPLVRYAFDKDNVCHLFAIQFGRNRMNDIDDVNFKKIVNQVNTGLTKYRDVSPSFVLSFALFLKMLVDNGVTKIVVPDFLFARYRRYHRASNEVKSNLVLERILDKYFRLLQRMEYQFEGFTIDNYPNEIDSYAHITIDSEMISKKNQFLTKILAK